MSLNIISNTENVLLARKDISAEVDFSGATPSKDSIKKMIAAKIGSDEKLIIISRIKNLYGQQKAKIIAQVYNSMEDLKKTVRVQEEKKEEKPDEEKKEEAKPTEKKSEEKETKKEEQKGE